MVKIKKIYIKMKIRVEKTGMEIRVERTEVKIRVKIRIEWIGVEKLEWSGLE
jgi:hypothetical protein